MQKHLALRYPVFIKIAAALLYAATVLSADTIQGISDEFNALDINSKVIVDWESADSVHGNYSSAIEKIRSSLPEEYSTKFESGVTRDAYVKACHWRRVYRMRNYTTELKSILYSRHHDLNGEIIGFLEEINTDGFVSNMGKWGATSCISKPSGYSPGGALSVLEFQNYYPLPKEILNDQVGVIKDPCVSFDGKKVVFAWSKDNNGYHLWEMEINNPNSLRQLTDDPEGLVVSDYEPCYLQNGDILFNSSRCFGFVECYYNMTSNLFIMNKDGKYLRRLSFDQVHTFYPTMMNDGKVLYSRWEYHDRNVLNCFGLFSMNPDGTQQAECFGNQTEWPATFIHARQIPDSRKILSVISGHRAPYAGDLVIIDPSIARNGDSAVKLIAPERPNPKVTAVDFGGNVENYNFQNPYPFSEECFLVSWRPNDKQHFALYFMNIRGERELIAWNDEQSLFKPLSLKLRKPPNSISYQTDYKKNSAVVTMHDAYYGMGTGASVEKGSIKKIRVIALEYRTDPAFGNTGSQGYQMTPVGRWTCSWEAKRIVGEIPVEEDGSASFEVPARTPLYLQLVDEKGRMIQTMRSWMTLQPGEVFGCYGCHEDKNEAPLSSSPALSTFPKKLERFYDVDETGYFSYPRHIQPILDKNCVKSGCHDKNNTALDLRGDKIWTSTLDADNRNACRFWNRSYINLTEPSKQYVNYIDLNTTAAGLTPNSVGSQKSMLLNMLLKGHHEVNLTGEDIEKIAVWIDLCIPHAGAYTDDMRETDAAKYRMRLERRKKHEELEEVNIQTFVASGGYDSYTNGSGVIKEQKRSIAGVPAVPRTFTAQFDSKSRYLSFTLPSAGELSVVDLNGRLILKTAVSPDAAAEGTGRGISCKIGAGVYLVKFKGATLNQERLLSVL